MLRTLLISSTSYVFGELWSGAFAFEDSFLEGVSGSSCTNDYRSKCDSVQKTVGDDVNKQATISKK